MARLRTTLVLYSLCHSVFSVPAGVYPRQDAASSSPWVTIDSGVVVGVQTSIANSPNLVNKFLGVPFAASPTRFAPAQTATPWSEPYEAAENGPACIQQFNYPEASRNFTIAAFNTPAPPESEDCLHVNIFAPASASETGELKPVMFWIYGGSLQFGWNGQAGYDGTSFAGNQDVIIVATNYRTNVFGFPSSPDLPLIGRNLGYLDQRFALAWVQRNIRAFGGDPDHVTIFGESAGSFSVDALVTSFGPSAITGPPLFRAAIMESGQSAVSGRNPADPASWTKLISALNCTIEDELACARDAPAATLKNIIERGAITFRPTADNYTQLQFPETARKAGQIAPVPVITGTNSNEGILFTFTQNNTEAYLRATLPSITDSQIQIILSTYTIGQRGISTQNQQIAAILTDFGFQCPAAIVANDSAAAGIPTWRYLYDGSFANIQLIPGVDWGAYHASEIPIVFGTYGEYDDEVRGTATENQKRLSELMQSMWAAFAKNPYGPPAPGWEDAGNGFVQIIGGPGGLDAQGRLRRDSSAAEVDGGRCELWRGAFRPS